MNGFFPQFGHTLNDQEIEMNVRLVMLTAACAALFAGAAVASDEAKRDERPEVIGLGSGTGMGSGAGTGSASSMADGFSSQSWSSGSGSQSFGGGFDQQTAGSGPLSSNPSAATGSGPTLTSPN